MVGIQGLGGVPEPKSNRPGKVRDDGDQQAQEAKSTGAGGAKATDDVNISSEARAAAEVGRIAQLAKNETEVRTERVQAARDNLERGNHKDPQVVRQVAERLLKYIT